MQWYFFLFALSYTAAMAASVTMILHARDEKRNKQLQNPFTPGIMIIANLLKAPLTYQEWKHNKTRYTQVLLAGVGVSNILWCIAFYYSI